MTSLSYEIGDIHVISLDEYIERIHEFEKNNPHIRNYVRFSAIDGSAIRKSELIEKGIVLDDITYKPGTLGCALSHIKLWEQCISENKPLTIAEDDTLFSIYFHSLATSLLKKLGTDWDFIQWGFNFEQCYIWVDLGFSRARLWFYDVDRSKERRVFLQSSEQDPIPVKLAHSLGLFCYSIKPAGARALINYCLPLRQRNIGLPGTGVFLPDQGIDVAMSGAYPAMKAFASFPPLVLSHYPQSTREALDNSAE